MTAFGGSFTALPTPFRDGRIDFSALRRLVERQIEGGTDGVVVTGTTGEAATLSDTERMAVLEQTVGAARGRIAVLAGIGTSDTRRSSDLARRAERAGASALLVSTPSYNRPSQEGLAAHFGAVARASALPLVLYDIPARTAVLLELETIARIATENRTVSAIKVSTDSLERLRAVIGLGAVEVLCGDDPMIPDAMEAGAVGAVSVVSNLVPGSVSELVHAFDPDGDRSRAPELAETVVPLARALALETNPAPLKAALFELGLASGELRLPLVSVGDGTRETLLGALAEAGLAPARD